MYPLRYHTPKSNRVAMRVTGSNPEFTELFLREQAPLHFSVSFVFGFHIFRHLPGMYAAIY